MTTIAIRRQQQASGLRPLDPTRDLISVADLIQEAFAEDLDRSGQAMLREMRSMAHMGPLFWWLDRYDTGSSSMLLGFVWIENDRVVGNVTINQMSPVSQRWVISNVAVNKRYRGHGIARQLMLAAFNLIRERRGKIITLQVRDDNRPALHIYKSLGFREIFGTTYMRLAQIPVVNRVSRPDAGGQLRVRNISEHDNQMAYRLVRRCVPEEVQLEVPIKPSASRLNIETWVSDGFKKLLGRGAPFRLALESRDAFAATIQLELETWRPESQLWLHVHPLFRGKIEKDLINRALHHLADARRQTLLVQHPTYHPEAIEAFQSFGFQTDRVLLWMRCDLHTSP
jgi:ribosomal protein S18 acetylase RimI-like enzyme